MVHWPDSIHLREVRTKHWGPCSLEIPARGLSVISGASGSGKSTLLHLILERECHARFQALAFCDGVLAQQFSSLFSKKYLAPRPSGSIEGLPLLFSPPQFNADATLATLFEFSKVLPLLVHSSDQQPVTTIAEQTAMIIDSFSNEAIVVATPFKTTTDEEAFRLEVAEKATKGMSHLVINGQVFSLDDVLPDLQPLKGFSYGFITDRLRISPAQRMRIEQALQFTFEVGEGGYVVIPFEDFRSGTLRESTMLSFHRTHQPNSLQAPAYEAWCEEQQIEDLEHYRSNTIPAARLFHYSLPELLEHLSAHIPADSNLLVLKAFRTRIEYGILLGLSECALWNRASHFSSSLLHKLRLLLTPVPFLENSGYLFDTPLYGHHPKDQKEICSFLEIVAKNSAVIVADNSEALIDVAGNVVRLTAPVKASARPRDLRPRGAELVGMPPRQVFRAELHGALWEFPARTLTFLIGDALENFYARLESQFDEITWSVQGTAQENMPKILDARCMQVKDLQRSTIGGALGITNELRRFFSSLPLAKVRGFSKKDFRVLGHSTAGTDEVLFKGLSFCEYLSEPLTRLSISFTHHPVFKMLFLSLEKLDLLHLSADRTLDSLSHGELARFELLHLLQQAPHESILFMVRLFSSIDEQLLRPMKELLVTYLEQGATIISIESNPLLGSWADRTILLGATVPSRSSH